MEFQRPNVYNKFLPFYESDLSSDADRFLEEIRSLLDLSKGLPSTEITNRFAVDLHKFIILYGFRFTREEHERFVRTLCALFVASYDPVTLENISKILVVLLKKKYLLPQGTLILPWKPLFDVYYFWEHSNASVRNLIPCQSGFKTSILAVIKYSRPFFSRESTREMLNAWRPLLNPKDGSMTKAMTFFNLFLPTSTEVGPPEDTYGLWLKEFFAFWAAYGNSPAWEIEFFHLLSRLALHNQGRIDWSPWVKDIFTKIMNALNLPVTYGGSGLKFKYGLSNGGGGRSLGHIARWIASTMGGGSSTMSYLHRLLCAIESYYYPANTNAASEILHSFINLLCASFVSRIHIERYNKKWVSKTPLDKRITDEEIDRFVEILMPITRHVLYSDFESEKKLIFNHLATLRPDAVLPMIIDRFRLSVETLTEPHRFQACINALAAATRPLVETKPLEVIQILTALLPGIDVNDIWKSTDIFILMSDILEMIWVIDFSDSAEAVRKESEGSMEVVHEPSDSGSLKIPKNVAELCLQSSVFEEFAMTFVDKCLRLVEHSSREETRSENDVMDDSYNDEEMAADAAITDTFQKIMARCSAPIFDAAFNKLKNYVQSRILEPAVAGGILAGMCKCVVVIKPEVTLKFFIPHLKNRITTLVEDRSRDTRRQDKELQFMLLLLSEVVNIKSIGVNVKGASCILQYVDDICSILDITLRLEQKDQYELASNILENLMFNLCHVRVIAPVPADLPYPIPYSNKFQWGLSGDLDTLHVDWYIPTAEDLHTLRGLIDKYLLPCLDKLTKFSLGELPMEKEEVLRNLRQVYKIAQGCSEVLEPLVIDEIGPLTVLSSIFPSMNKLNIRSNDRPLRKVIYEVCHAVKEYLFSISSDDTVSLDSIVSIFDVLLFSFGLDEDELNDHSEEHRTMKHHRENRLIRSKKHLQSILIDRIVIQYRTFIWLKNLIATERTPPQIINDIFELGVYRYSEVRAFAQELMTKLLFRPTTEKIHEAILNRVIECLHPNASHEQFKGALHIIYSQKFHFMYSWNSCLRMMPALIKAQHSDKTSIIELLKYISAKINRSFSDHSLFHIPTKDPKPCKEIYEFLGFSTTVWPLPSFLVNKNEDQEDEDFIRLELVLVDLIQNGNLHWRHYQMAIGILLGLINHVHYANEKVVRIWLDALVHDDRTIRLTAFQAVEAILKVIKIKRPRVYVEISNENINLKPGIREDNKWMQYRNFDCEEEFQNYWMKPFSVKSDVGYYYWQHKKTKLRVVDESVPEKDINGIRSLVCQRFSNPDYVAKFIYLNSIEHKKGEDFFSMDKAFFYVMLFENFNDTFLDLFFTNISPLARSSEESHQRVAAEVVCGIIGGSRFWTYKKTKILWEKYLLPLFENLLEASITSETLNDWEVCFSSISNKTDQNRLRWLYEFIIDKQLVSGVRRAFQESGVLRLLNRIIMQNWKVMDLFNRTYDVLKENLDHPYTKVRLNIAKVMATLMTMDVEYPNGWNAGTGFPTCKEFISHVLPQLNLNYRNPVINGGANHNDFRPESSECDETSRGATDDDDDLDEDAAERKKKSNNALETVSNWCQYYIQTTSGSIQKDMYKLLPFFCQFIGVETDQELSHSCLNALCFLSVCIVPVHVVPFVLEMSERIIQSDSYKAKLSLLEFVQVFVFSNFLSLCADDQIVSRIENFILNLMSDDNLQVRTKAAKILCGLIHSKFLGSEAFDRLLKNFRAKIRPRMMRNKKKSRFTKDNSSNEIGNKEKIAEFHSGILGLCSFVEAYPYEVPDFVPDILIELETHLHDPTPIPKTIKKTLQEFKRTHQDNWDEHKSKFTEDQLQIMTELLVSPNYYA